MAGPDETSVRTAVAAGMFYPGEANACRELAASYLRPAVAVAGSGAAQQQRKWIGGIVPHAGWICSGAVAGETIATLTEQVSADLVVIFGAVHTPLPLAAAALDSHGCWNVPSGTSITACEVERKLVERDADEFHFDDRFHAREHAIEVELPLVQLAWPGAAVLPIEVPTFDSATAVGRRVAELVIATGLNPVYLASSDLTHYGPDYGFAPCGIGPDGIRWAKANDRRLLDLIEGLRVEQVVPEVKGRLNACGGGAIAAMLAACREHGASHGKVLRQTCSYETLLSVAPQPATNSVGYASVVVG